DHPRRGLPTRARRRADRPPGSGPEGSHRKRVDDPPDGDDRELRGEESRDLMVRRRIESPDRAPPLPKGVQRSLSEDQQDRPRGRREARRSLPPPRDPVGGHPLPLPDAQVARKSDRLEPDGGGMMARMGIGDLRRWTLTLAALLLAGMATGCAA